MVAGKLRRASATPKKRATRPRTAVATGAGIQKLSTGIAGVDQITVGGLPSGRLTAVVGGPGTGKSLLALQFLVHRLKVGKERALYVTFEEATDRIRQNVAGFNWGFENLSEDQLTLIDARLPADVVQAGSFDLSALLANLGARAAENGATNVVFDGIDLLLHAINDEILERQELARINDWVRAGGMTAILTVKEYGTSGRERNRADLIQYITDCVVLLSADLVETSISRVFRVLKYRGSGFSANAAPMVIGTDGLSVVPAQTDRGSHPVFSERISTGVERLDAILDGGFTRGTSILVTGAPGTAKTSLAGSLARAACEAGRRVLFVSFDESGAQIIANMKSIGIRLDPFVRSGHLLMQSFFSGGSSPEASFLSISRLIAAHLPDVLIVDPMSAFLKSANPFAQLITESLIDLAKTNGITFLGTSLSGNASGDVEMSLSHVSTIADTWLHLSYVAQKGERNRALTVVKSRGTAHSNQVRELSLSSDGLALIDVYVGEGEVLMGSARLWQEEEVARAESLRAINHRHQMFAHRRDIDGLKARITGISEELASKESELEILETAESLRVEASSNAASRRSAARRQADDRVGDAGKKNSRRR